MRAGRDSASAVPSHLPVSFPLRRSTSEWRHTVSDDIDAAAIIAAIRASLVVGTVVGTGRPGAAVWLGAAAAAAGGPGAESLVRPCASAHTCKEQ